MRLMTRSDFDGLACAVLLVEKGIVDEYKFVHPKDVQDGKVEVTANDVMAATGFPKKKVQDILYKLKRRGVLISEKGVYTYV